jgi:hypothetical protein
LGFSPKLKGLMSDLQDYLIRPIPDAGKHVASKCFRIISFCLRNQEESASTGTTSEFIVQHLEQLCVTDKFLDVADENLFIILNRCWLALKSSLSSSICCDDKLRWEHQAPNKRLMYLKQE